MKSLSSSEGLNNGWNDECRERAVGVVFVVLGWP